MEQLEAIFENSITVLKQAYPARLFSEANLGKREMVDLEKSKAKTNKGLEGRLSTQTRISNYCKLQTILVVKLACHFLEKWERNKKIYGHENSAKLGKIITHGSIKRATKTILNEYPLLCDKLNELRIKGRPFLPSSMEAFFRFAMPREMVNGTNTDFDLAPLIKEHIKERKSDFIAESYFSVETGTDDMSKADDLI